MNFSGVKSLLKGPLLAARSAALKPLALFEPPSVPHPGAVRKILVVRTDRLGDLVLSLPFLRALRTAYPGAEITLVARSFASEIVSHEADYIIGPDTPDLKRELRLRAFDLAIDMYYGYELATAFLCRSSGARWRAGFDIGGRGFLFNVRVPALERKHFIDETADILSALEVPQELKPPSVEVRRGDAAAASALLAGKGLASAALAAVHPGGFYQQQRWPAARFVGLLNRLHASKGFSFLLFGGPGDSDLLASIASGLKGPHLAAAGLDLRLAAALMGRASLFIGNNSGPLHLACALGLPTVSTMGPTDPVRWAPVGLRNAVVRKEKVEDITVEEMEQAVLGLSRD
ncbi:MAG: glycosyltransferase family 9 protein [Elusimicrobia bacterium]|nr:glycosyltransferase family 9 protein [Elusimicrobiota bacterium]